MDSESIIFDFYFLNTVIKKSLGQYIFFFCVNWVIHCESHILNADTNEIEITVNIYFSILLKSINIIAKYMPDLFNRKVVKNQGNKYEVRRISKRF